MNKYDGLTVNYNSNYIAVVSETEGDFYNEETGELDYWQGYSITLHNGMMPAFETRRFDTLQELANGMRELADLRTWKAAEFNY